MTSKLLIKNGHIIDPANSLDAEMDILIEDGRILKVARSIKANGVEVLDAKEKIVAPGFIDMHTHLREPGREDEETLKSGAMAALHGGFTTVACMPNTQPATDNRAQVEYILREAERNGLARIVPVGAISKTLAGEEMAEFFDMHGAGAVAVSDDGRPVMNAELMRRALEYARTVGILVISHCEDLNLSKDGLMNEGYSSTVLGLKPIPPEAEYTAVARDISLARLTGGRLHIAHVSTLRSMDLIRQAKKEGLNVTAETAPHYFALDDSLLKGYDTNLKVNPPLRSKEDIRAIKEALRDGTIEVIATDHAPHAASEKDMEFALAPFGMIGLETALGLCIMELVEKGALSLSALIEKLCVNPARILGLNAGALSVGAQADVVIFDPTREWEVRRENFLSMSKNSPFIGWHLKGEVETTICRGKILWRR